MLDVLILTSLTLLALVAWCANVLGMPGNWVIVCFGVVCVWLAPAESQYAITLLPLILIIGAAALGELLEFLAGAMGASRLGASKRGTVLAVLGSIGGAILGLVFGTALPPPILGNVIASLMLGGAGAFIGAVTGERWAGKSWDESFDVGSAAFWGRLLGTVGKAVCGTLACTTFIVAIWL